MRNLGFTVARSTVAAILDEQGIAPAPERGRSMTWSEFLRAHWEAIAAMDFFTVEVLTLTGLVRYHVLFVLELETRAVHIAGVVHQPDGAWMMQVGRHLTDAVDGFLLGQTQLIMDSKLALASFGEDEQGELYVLDLNGTLYRLIANTK